MTLEIVQRMARDLEAKTRRQLLGTLAAPLATAFLYVFGITAFPSLSRELHPPFAFALAWSLVGLYFLNRRMWPAATPEDAGLSSGLAFCRREIERRHRLLGGVLLWSFGPVLLAIGTLIFALAVIGASNRGIFPNGLPFLILVAIWIFGYFVKRLREQRALKREAEELHDIERKNR